MRFLMIFVLMFTGSAFGEALNPVKVKTVTVNLAEMTKTIKVYGKIIADEQAMQMVSLPYNGMVRQIFVRTGERVSVGQPLIDVASGPSQKAAYEQAKNAVEYAQRQYDHQQELFSQELTKSTSVQDAKKQLNDAKAMLNSLSPDGGNESHVTIIALSSGIVTTINVTTGQRFQSDSTLLSVAGNAGTLAVVNIDGHDRQYIVNGASSTVHSITQPQNKANANVEQVSALISPATGLGQVYLRLENTAQTPFLIGSSVAAQIEINNKTGVRVPIEAVLNSRDSDYVFLIREGKAVRMQVKTGDIVGRDIEILSGVKSGDKVITLGNYELNDGQPVSDSL